MTINRQRTNRYISQLLASVFATGSVCLGVANAQEIQVRDAQELDIASGAVLKSGEAVFYADENPGPAIMGADARTALGSAMVRSNTLGVASPAMALSLKETEKSLNTQTGETLSRFEQEIGGMRVYGAYAKTVLSENGQLLFASHRLASDLAVHGADPTISPRRALRTAIRQNFGKGIAIPKRVSRSGTITTMQKTDFFFSEPTVEKVYYFTDATVLEQGFLVATWSQEDNLYFHTLISGDGQVVANEKRTSEDRIRIYFPHPGRANSQVITTNNGWTTGTQRQFYLRGPNTLTYLDRNANNAPDSGGSVISGTNFTTRANLSQSPTTSQNRRAAIQNLFFWNNYIHDYLEARGFGNSQGNFEGNDPVLAEAQDGSGTNNANFSTPPNGSSPRMQMFLWTATNPSRDGDLDSDIIWHEYGHGLTWRMVGGMSGDVAGAIGEGMGDVLAINFDGDDRVGEYSSNRTNGIRSSRYGQHRDTLGDFNRSRGVHRNGEIYAATIWRLRGLYQNANLSTSNTLMPDLIRGLTFTPSRPTYIEMRNGLLAATPNSRDCLVWRAFAEKGMGTNATMSDAGSVRESFAVPNGC